ncbi:MAG TPA: hypothetical protein VGK04_01375 [Thermoanaerobaculia bacterium]|jgi:hypothetical protein
MFESSVFAVIVVALSIPASAGSLLTTPTPSLMIGRFTAEPESFASVSLPLTLTSDTAWEIFVSRVPSANPNAHPSGEKLFVHDAQGDWSEVRETAPTLIAAGLPTDPSGATLIVELRATATLDSSVGERGGTVEFRTAGAPPLDVDYRYEVLPTLSVTETSEEQLAGLVPTKAGTYPFVSKTYLVKANVPWVLEIALRRPLMTKGGVNSIGGEKIVVLSSDHLPAVPLKLDRPVRIAHGNATGEAGVIVPVRLALANTTLEPAGTYSGEIDAVVRQNGDPRP